MIPCDEFIPAYSELFKFLEKKGGEKEVADYWEYLAENAIPELAAAVEKKGIRGCFDYWSKTLNEEAADFTMTLDEKNQVFTIEMFRCPSKGRLLQPDSPEPYRNYCGHCDVLYRRVLEKLGFHYEYDLSRTDVAACSLRVTGPTRPKGDS